CGELATSHRENFKKFYDLSERVIPAQARAPSHDDEVQIDWLCTGALDRLGAATLGEVQKFWDAADPAEVRTWAQQSRQSIIPVEIQSADGTWSKAIAPDDIEMRLAALSAPTSRLRILNPFDPAVRDRARLKRLFGFDYRIEIFVPAAKRQWGYYVFPLLEGERFIGRLEVRADRAQGKLTVANFWPESGINWTARRTQKLEAELARLARLVSAGKVNWLCERP
ncbi:MAG: winged helix DNA-binding domain-containing protein, partial [Fimbriimonadaceae bacterium]|nr:winged helix DNA-binding domain-containing protein [Alphaproteobacteria bacterium]